MITQILHFWNSFENHKESMVVALKRGHNYDDALAQMRAHLQKIHKDLSLIILVELGQPPRLHFITKGRLQLKKLVTEILVTAPYDSGWSFHNGIMPWEGNLMELCNRHPFLGEDTVIYEVYFDIVEIYKSSCKLALVVYVEKNRSHPKYIINDSMKTLLLMYFGDEMYYQNIARIKIAQRKYRAYNFAPISQLKKILEFAIKP